MVLNLPDEGGPMARRKPSSVHHGVYKVPLMLAPQPDGGWVVTSPVLPELLTEGDTIESALGNVEDAIAAVLELYEDLGKALPENLRQEATRDPVWFEHLVRCA